MSAHLEYRCDMCAKPGQGRYSFMHTPTVPKGWHGWDGKHLCSYACLIAHLKEVQLREEGPLGPGLRKAFEAKESTPFPDEKRLSS